MAREFYYNLVTGQVEDGHQSDWSQLLGPYPTREAAARALDKAHERTEAWDEADRAWRGWRESDEDDEVADLGDD